MIKDFISKMVLDETDSPSTKRVIALIGSGILFLALFINAVTPFDVSVSQSLIDGAVTVICVCLGASTIDKFSKKDQ